MAKIVICCFGITRSLRHTIRSIRRNVLEPAAAQGETMVCCHFFDQTTAISVSGKEEGTVDVGEADLLKPDWIRTEAPGACLETWNFDAIRGYGDFWDNGFISARNLVHQLHSLNTVTGNALEEAADIVIFCRPDLRYHDSLAPVLEDALAQVNQQDIVFLPAWQSWGGYNDRFAVAVGTRAIATYGQRVRRALPYCRETGRALHAEQLLKHVLTDEGITVRMIKTRASRVRASGYKVWESFGDELANQRHERFKFRLWTLLDRSGMKSVARRLARLVRPRKDGR